MSAPGQHSGSGTKDGTPTGGFGHFQHRRRTAKGARRLSRQRHRASSPHARPHHGRAAPGAQRRRHRDGRQHGGSPRHVELSVVQSELVRERISETTFKGLLNEGAFTNYPIQGLYTPGSTFKLISATAQCRLASFPPRNSWTTPDTSRCRVACRGAHGCVFHDDQGQGAGL